MKLNKTAETISAIIIISLIAVVLSPKLATASPGVITVPDDYPTIRAAIDAAEEGATIFVKAGTYHENIIIRKALKLIGEGNNTIIDGIGEGHTVKIETNNVELSRFTIKGASKPWAGVYLYYSFFNTIKENRITGNYYGIYLYDSGENVLKKNNLTGNYYNLKVWGLYLPHFLHDIDTSNTVDNKPVYYWINHSKETVPSDVGYVAIVNSTNVTAENLILTNNGEGILLAHSNTCLIKNITVSKNERGMRILFSHNNTILENTVTENEWSGIFLDSSRDNTIVGNEVANNTWDGILLSYSPLLPSSSDNNLINENTITSNSFGVYLDTSHNNTIYRNTIVENRHQGIRVVSSQENFFNENAVADNDCGVWVYDSDNNIFCSNNFINNTDQVCIVEIPRSYNNVWDDGYPSGGNYWSDYHGIDLYGGLYQNETISDGIGDSPYLIDANNIDRYPLMTPATLLYYKTLGKYENLSTAYQELFADYNALNSTYHTLLSNYSKLQGNYDSLNTNYINLNASYDELKLQQESTQAELSTIRNLMFIFTATVVVLVVVTIYLAKRGPKL